MKQSLIGLIGRIGLIGLIGLIGFKLIRQMKQIRPKLSDSVAANFSLRGFKRTINHSTSEDKRRLKPAATKNSEKNRSILGKTNKIDLRE